MEYLSLRYNKKARRSRDGLFSPAETSLTAYIPRYARRTSSDAASSAALPDNATRPLCIT